jgi:hypothetical protein
MDARCPGGCGQPQDESHGPDADGAYTCTAFRCHACAARQYAAAEFEADGGDTKGLFWITERVKQRL